MRVSFIEISTMRRRTRSRRYRAAATFAEICEVVAADGGEQDPVAAMNRMLARWLADGLLVRG